MVNKANIFWPGWKTVRVIGHGSFSTVYEIQRQLSDVTEYAALKMIKIPCDESEINALQEDGYDKESIIRYFDESRQKVENEYAKMASLKGQANIVCCDDYRSVCHDDGFGWDVCIKMELLTPLKTAQKSMKRNFNEQTVINLGADICDALSACKQLDIVHRDIKPENIFVTKDGRFKLGDFGIAKTMESTARGTKTGTFDYMSPEVYNNEPYHTEADIYSLGLVMYWLLNDEKLPFIPKSKYKPTLKTKEEAVRRRCSGEPIPEPEKGTSELKRIVLKACAFDPRERYSGAGEMRRDLEAIRLSKPLPLPEEERANNGENINEFRSKHKKIFIASAIAFIIAGFILICIGLRNNISGKSRDISRGSPDISKVTDNFNKKTVDEKTGVKESHIKQKRLLPRLVDNADFLNEEDEEDLNEVLDEISERQKFDIVVVTATELEEETAISFAEDFYWSNGYGQDENRNGFILLLGNVDRDHFIYNISAFGFNETTLQDGGWDGFWENSKSGFLSELENGNYAQAFKIFAEKSDAFISEVQKKRAI